MLLCAVTVFVEVNMCSDAIGMLAAAELMNGQIWGMSNYKSILAADKWVSSDLRGVYLTLVGTMGFA